MVTKSYTYVGVMSGSSLDGLDVALVTILCDPQGSYVNYEIVDFTTAPYPPNWSDKLKNYDQGSPLDFLRMQSDYSYLVAELINDCVDRWSISATDIRAIGLHGHTLLHIPEDGITVQIGNGGIVAALTGIATVSDFRVQDVARRGQGAPIVPILENDVLRGYDAYLNFGGIANISIPSRQVAYDICPLNQVLNHFAHKCGKDYDPEGSIARSGSINNTVLRKLQEEDYFALPYPKTLDNNYIRRLLIPLLEELDAADALATAVECFAREIAKSIGEENKVLITGGGAYNVYLLERLKEHSAQNVDYIVPERLIIEAKEAVLMAYMAHLRMQRKVNIHSHYTGARKDTIAGALYE